MGLGTVMKMLGHKLNEEELEECIKMVDADGGGSVDIDEFMELMSTKTKEAQDEIHTDVIKENLQKLDGTLSEADLGDLIAEIDSDGSGWVDYDKFKALMLG